MSLRSKVCVPGAIALADSHRCRGIEDCKFKLAHEWWVVLSPPPEHVAFYQRILLALCREQGNAFYRCYIENIYFPLFPTKNM